MLKLPDTEPIRNCLERLLIFCAMDCYIGYDCDAVREAQEHPDQIAKGDVASANRHMRAWSHYSDWRVRGLLDEHLPELAQLPNEDLIEMTEDRWREVRGQLRCIYCRLCRPRIGNVAASKVLYLKRPRLIALCDSVVKDVLQIGPGRKVEEALDLTAKVRDVGRANLTLLADLSSKLAAIELEGEPIHLTKTRMLDIILWTSRSRGYNRLIALLPAMS